MKLLNTIKNFWKKLGPWLVTWTSDDDPSGIATYSQAWAQFGFQTLWTAFITFPLMTAIQEICGRIWLITKHWISGVIKRHYSPWLMYVVWALTIPACIFNIWADLSGMWAVANLVLPDIHSQVFIFWFSIIIVLSIIFFSYPKFASIMKRLTITLAVYIIIPFLVNNNYLEILKFTFIPHITRNKDFLMILVAILWTTISPYLFFWEASVEVEDEKEEIQEAKDVHKKMPSMLQREKTMQKDNFFGMLFSNIAMYFIILTAWSVLFKNGITNVATVQDVASALKPLAWNWSYALFAIWVIWTWFIAIPVLAWACSYIVSETFNRWWWVNADWKTWRSFYLVIIISVLLGALLNIFWFDPIKMLIWTAILYWIIAPPLILILLHISNNKKIMWNFTNNKRSNILWILCLLVMTVAVIAMFIV